jgi:hypothetical protein
MLRRSIFVASLAVACLFVSQTVYASSVVFASSVHAMFARSKTIRFELHNASPSPLNLRAGDKVMTVKVDETITVDLPVGTRIVTNVASDAHPAGTLVLQVAAGFDGTTVTLH